MYCTEVKRNPAYFSTELFKDPMMTFFPRQVIDRFPEGRYVFVIRDPRDNIRSFLNRRGNIPGNLKNLPSAMRSPRSTFNADMWGAEDENYIGILAHRWNCAVHNYLEHQDRLTLASYEDFCADKPAFIARLATSIGLLPTNDISAKVDIQYQPGGDRHVSWNEFFGDDNLHKIETICGSLMKQLNYRYHTDAR